MKIDRQDKPLSAPSLTLVSTAGDRDGDDGNSGAPSLASFHEAWPDDQWFPAASLQETFDAVAQAVRGGERAVLLIEGENGAGKTAFLRRLARELATDAAVCHFEVRLALGERHVLARIAEVYGCPPVTGVAELASLLARHSAGRALVLIVDNADRLSRFALRALFELKRRTTQGGGRIVLVIGVRPDGIDATLALPTFASYGGADFLRRIDLPRFSEEDTATWLRQIGETAGMASTAFDDTQVRLIHRASHGLPRQIRRVAGEVLEGRKPRRWRSRYDETRARQLKYRVAGIGVSVVAIAGVVWLLAAVLGTPRIELAFDGPVPILPDQSSLPLPPAPADAGTRAEPSPVMEGAATPAAQPPAPRPQAAQPQAPQPSAAPTAPRTAAPPPSPAPVSATPAIPVGQGLSGRAWLMAQAPDRYTLQIASSPDRALAEQLIERNQIGGMTTVIATRRGDRTLYLVVHGSFGGQAEAREAIAALPPQIRRNDPFVRTMRSLQDIAIGR